MAQDLLEYRKFSEADLSLFRRTIAADCNISEFDLFMADCHNKRLNPASGQIYAFVFNKDNPDKRKMAIVMTALS